VTAPYDVAVVGGGIVGLATARALLIARPGRRVVVLEKEDDVARHQTGRNSGVIHSGLYYRPGSAKARLCRAGSRSIVEYARNRGVAHEITGKLVVATSTDELPGLAALEERGRANGLHVRRLDPAQAAELEPHLSCVAALHVPETGVIDFVGVAHALAADVRAAGGEVRTGCRVTASVAVRGVHRLATTGGDVRARVLVNCAGLQSDLVARAAGAEPPARIIPFRGEYYELRPDARHLVRGLVYPVPDPAFPFLGVHLTRGIDGSVHAGPNAVLALAREGYRWRDVRPGELLDTLRSPAFRHLARRHARQGLTEVVRSLSRRRFLASLQRLVPELTDEDLVPAPSGVRAQAVRPDGGLVDDFLIVERPGELHVLNAPSPAATSSLEIGAEIARRLAAVL
jgi:L-2-hydroxyglutarate oxidase